MWFDIGSHLRSSFYQSSNLEDVLNSECEDGSARRTIERASSPTRFSGRGDARLEERSALLSEADASASVSTAAVARANWATVTVVPDHGMKLNDVRLPRSTLCHSAAN